MRVLILCTGNSCRSQMAHGFLKSFNSKLDVHSAGTNPASRVNPLAVQVMREAGIDISNHQPKNVNGYINKEWDYVITVCDNARETCPVFSGKVKHTLHIGFDDPSGFRGSENEILKEFRRIRDEIHDQFLTFYNEKIK
jgi:arsenate reductase (thioredoxin)